MSDAKPRAQKEHRAPRGRCPICTSEMDDHYRPFCSKRCADIDLGRWVTGAYAIAGGDADSDEDGDANSPENAGNDPTRQ